MTTQSAPTTPMLGRHPDWAGPQDIGLVMGGGGARAAYQVGFLRTLAKGWPDLVIPYLTGVSAGAINAAHLASHHGNLEQAVEELYQLWSRLRIEDVFQTDLRSLGWNVIRWARRLASGGSGSQLRVRGLVDTSPLRSYLNGVLHAVDGEITGIQYNLDRGRLRAIALSSSSYTTGQSVTFVQGSKIHRWERPSRQARNVTLSVEHVMASAALPVFFPAVQVGNEWFGDGGIRLAAPLSPALHLGARRVLAISTRYGQTTEEASAEQIEGYPPPAQIAGVLMNSIFLDLLDHDAMRLDQMNDLLRRLPPEERNGLRPVELLVLRPSQDLGRLAGEFEPQLPKGFRFLTRGLGTTETRSPDFLSLILFQPDYLQALMEIGQADAEARAEEIGRFLTVEVE